jgi:hypothetical protein
VFTARYVVSPFITKIEVFTVRYGLGPYITKVEGVYNAVRTMSLYNRV